MNKEQAKKLGLKHCIFHKGYESKIIKIIENRVTWYDHNSDKILNGKITEIESDEIHLISDEGINTVFGR